MAAGILLTEMQNTHFGLGSCSQASLSVLSLCGINLRYVAFPLPLVLALSPAVVFSLPAGEGDSFPLPIPPVHESLQPAKHKDNVYTVHVKYFRQLLSALCIEKEGKRNPETCNSHTTSLEAIAHPKPLAALDPIMTEGNTVCRGEWRHPTHA